MLVTSESYVGHIRIVLWVSGSTGMTHFQPWIQTQTLCKSENSVMEYSDSLHMHLVSNTYFQWKSCALSCHNVIPLHS